MSDNQNLREKALRLLGSENANTQLVINQLIEEGYDPIHSEKIVNEILAEDKKLGFKGALKKLGIGFVVFFVAASLSIVFSGHLLNIKWLSAVFIVVMIYGFVLMGRALAVLLGLNDSMFFKWGEISQLQRKVRKELNEERRKNKK